MPAVLITGGTGLIGKALSKALVDIGYEVIILSRNLKNTKDAFPEKTVGESTGILSSAPRLSYATWNIEEQTIDKDAIARADFIVHLAGANLAAKRWTSKRKKEIVESRTRSSELLVKALNENTNQVKAVISASAIGWYGSDSNSPENGDAFTESDPPGDDFLAITCQQWESSIEPVTALGKRLVKLRTGIVLSNDGGALKEFKKPLRFGFATILGNGKQVMSWIHVGDLVRMYILAIESERLHGVYNAVAPHPVSNKKFILQLARSVRGKFYVPLYVPKFVLKAVLGEMSIEVLKSANVSNKKIDSTGFRFLYPSVTAALHQLK
jgi:uncharacterized protein (TIGR01777 family)